MKAWHAAQRNISTLSELSECTIQGRIARAFSRNSLVNAMDMTAAIQYILTAAQLLGLYLVILSTIVQVYYKKSRMTILGRAGVLFCENGQT